jgi:translation initiation factor 2B subunit (eIF-2B alpha/beta/delta family)
VNIVKGREHRTNHNVQAKDALCDKIDNYIRDRIVVAGEVIQDTAGRKIKDGDVILTYARYELASEQHTLPASSRL